MALEGSPCSPGVSNPGEAAPGRRLRAAALLAEALSNELGTNLLELSPCPMSREVVSSPEVVPHAPLGQLRFGHTVSRLAERAVLEDHSILDLCSPRAPAGPAPGRGHVPAGPAVAVPDEDRSPEVGRLG